MDFNSWNTIKKDRHIAIAQLVRAYRLKVIEGTKCVYCRYEYV